jgi:hypothetical protein
MKVGNRCQLIRRRPARVALAWLGGGERYLGENPFKSGRSRAGSVADAGVPAHVARQRARGRPPPAPGSDAGLVLFRAALVAVLDRPLSSSTLLVERAGAALIARRPYLIGFAIWALWLRAAVRGTKRRVSVRAVVVCKSDVDRTRQT